MVRSRWLRLMFYVLMSVGCDKKEERDKHPSRTGRHKFTHQCSGDTNGRMSERVGEKDKRKRMRHNGKGEENGKTQRVGNEQQRSGMFGEEKKREKRCKMVQPPLTKKNASQHLSLQHDIQRAIIGRVPNFFFFSRKHYCRRFFVCV